MGSSEEGSGQGEAKEEGPPYSLNTQARELHQAQSPSRAIIFPEATSTGSVWFKGNCGGWGGGGAIYFGLLFFAVKFI